MTFDEKLTKALEESFDERMEQRLNVTKKHRFSLAYKLWEHKTLKSLKKNPHKNKWTLRRARIIVLTVIVLLALLIGAVASSNIFYSIGRFSFRVSEKNYTGKYYKVLHLECTPSDKTVINEFYLLSEESGCEHREYTHLSEQIEYVRENNMSRFGFTYMFNDNPLQFEQYVFHNRFRYYNYGISLYDKIIPVSLYEENDGFYVERSEKTYGPPENVFGWVYDGYYFELQGFFTKEEAIKLAYSTKIVDISEIT